MLDPKVFDDIAKKLSDAVPTQVKDIKHDLEKNFQSILQGTFNKLDLVTREEFDVQNKVLTRTREQLIILEQRLAKLKPQQTDEADKKPND